MKSFKEFQLNKNLIAALEKLGYRSPSPVQTRVIPRVLQGKSIVCQSETGSGKTHAYLIPLLEKTDIHLPRLQSIVICPSRELARQVYEFASAFTRFFPSFKVRLFSSESESSQNKAGTSIAPQMVIGTPGRLKEILSEEYALDLHGVRSLVLDEADMLLELGYFEDIDALYQKLPEGMQTLVFSATMTEPLKQQLEKYIGSEFLYESEQNKTSRGVAHHLVDVKHVGTFEALSAFLKARRPYFALIFASKKETVNAAYAFLKGQGVDALCFTGDLDTRERKAALRRIRSNKFAVICCSDLLSRDIDLEDVTDVISLDLPGDISYYFHRAGRTGRFDKQGDSWVFYNADSWKKTKILLDQGVTFDYFELKAGRLVQSEGVKTVKERFTKKKAFSEDEAREVKIAKANTRSDKVKPGYKKKTREAVEKVKGKYRRKAIQKSIRKRKNEKYAAEARAKKE